MDATNCLMGLFPCAKLVRLCRRTKKFWPGHETMFKKNHFNLEVKGQGNKKDTNVRDILSHGDTRICQIWYVYVEEQRNCGPDTNMHK